MIREHAGREQTVLDLLVEALPHLRGGLRGESANFTARLLYENLGLDAAAVVSSTDGVLAFIGAGSDHHLEGSPNLTDVTRRTLASGRPYTTSNPEDIGCPLTAVTVAPFIVRGNVVGALKMYRAGRDMEERDARVAIGLARVFSVYLEVADLDARAALVTQAELEALRAQISPHFLFNTLTTIAALTRTDPSRAHDLLVDFAEYFRETLARHGEFVTLDEELENVERYLRFEHARFGANLRVAFEVDARSRLALVPVLSIQPLVENAIAHGIGSRSRGSIRIRARFRNAGVEISIIDDGVGIAADAVHNVLNRGFGTGLGLGLNNVHQRLIGAFGPRSGLQLASTEGTGTTVAFWIPMRGPKG
jgi:LytS/YehU family sensor histidine kinase